MDSHSYTFDRNIRLSAYTDGLLRRTARLARSLANETQSQLLGRLLAKERRRLFRVARSRGQTPEHLESAAHSPDDPFPDIPKPDATPIDDVGPRE